MEILSFTDWKFSKEATRKAREDEVAKSFGFNDNVIAVIDAISKKDGESIDDYMNRVKNNKLACSVKKADLLHNMDISRLKVVNKKDLERLDKYQYIYNYLCI